MTLELKHRPNKFIFELKKYSNNKEDPISEWDFTKDIQRIENIDKKCICSTSISVIYKIKNKYNDKVLEIGSECVKRWIKPKIYCIECKSVIGNVIKRTNEQDFTCPKCKKQKLDKLISYNCMLLYNKPFRDYSKDISFIEKIINKEDKTTSEKLFEEYVNMIYEIKEVQVQE